MVPGTRCMNTPDMNLQVSSSPWHSGTWRSLAPGRDVQKLEGLGVCLGVLPDQFHLSADNPFLFFYSFVNFLTVSTVNSVCWGPYEFGLILACGSSDGAISLLTFTGDQQWDVKKINNAHTVSLPQRWTSLLSLSLSLVDHSWSSVLYSECVASVECSTVSFVFAPDWLQRGELGSRRSSRQPDRSAIRTEAKLHQTFRLWRLRQPG